MTLPLRLQTNHKRNTVCIFSVLALLLMLAAAGCVANQPASAPEDTEIPPAMADALAELAADFSTVETSVHTDLQDLSALLGTARSSAEVRQTLERYYVRHLYLSSVIYYDAVMGEYTPLPDFMNVADYFANITEQDFKNAGGFILRNIAYPAKRGVMSICFVPVYSPAGEYRGCLGFLGDIPSVMHIHPAVSSKPRLYDSYVCVIADGDENILYSSQSDAGGRIPPEGLYTGGVYLPDADSAAGACRYLSTGLSGLAGAQTEMLTGWQTLVSGHGRVYTLYLAEEMK